MAAQGSRFEEFGRRVDAKVGNIGPKIEEEVRRVIDYLNDQVVPQVRMNSSSALRAAAEQLGKLADHLDQQRKDQNRRPPSASAGNTTRV